ncbi:putative RPA-interacting protein [Helianthus debilis subsp. tardiflorus]
MANGEEDKKTSTRSSIKSHNSFNNYPRWKDKLRENCYNRLRADRSRLLWKMRSSVSTDHSPRHEELIKSTFQDIVSDELRKIKETPLKSCSETSDDMLWEYDGLHAAYQGDCEEILLEMQKIFYEDLKNEQDGKEFIKVWDDEEDEYLARAVFENMHLNDEKVGKEVWCPICKQGVLQQNRHRIFCSLCQLELDRGDEVTLEILRDRLAEAHGQHFDTGCRLTPKFCIQSKFDIAALYMECQDCKTFEIVI